MKEVVSTPKSSYQDEIDGLRALAVVAVIINHFNKNLLPSGYLGVDIFFVISGYVITSSLANRPSKNFMDFLLGFYTRRIKRLVPALVLYVVVSSVLICLVTPSPNEALKTGARSLFGLSNLYLFQQATNYFGASAELNVYTHTWSLGVEEQFYFVFPFLLWFSGFSRLSAKGERNLFGVLGMSAVASLLLFIYLNRTNQPAAYFLMPARFWELSVGSLLFLGLSRGTISGLMSRVRPLAVMAFLIAALFIPLQLSVLATIVVVLLIAVLIASLRPQTAAYSLLTHPRVVYIGLISYSLYLWHWSVLSISHWTIGFHWWSVPIQVSLMLLLAIASYRYVETPLRRAEWSAVRWKSIGYGIGASTASAGLMIAIAKTPNLRLYTGKYPSLVAVGADSLTQTYTLPKGISTWRGERCVLSDNRQVGKTIHIEDCTLGDFSAAKRRVLVLGNSFSAAFVQAFDPLVLLDKYSVTITSSWGAPPVAEFPSGGLWDKANDYYWKSVVPYLVSRLRPGDWVFLVSKRYGGIFTASRVLCF